MSFEGEVTTCFVEKINSQLVKGHECKTALKIYTNLSSNFILPLPGEARGEVSH